MYTLDELERLPLPEPRSEIEALELQLSRTAATWRETKEARYVKEYHDIYHQLHDLGWNGAIDLDMELPDELMPKDWLEMQTKRTSDRDKQRPKDD